jgi:alkylation response protein AidB-like acyl-CoA dehydrogenase
MVMACFPAATILGVAEQMFEDFLEIARVRDDEYFAVSKALAPGLQLRAAESALDLKAALTLLREVAARMDHFVFDVVRPSLKEKAEIRYALAYIVQKARTAAGRLYDAAGANAT